MCVVSNQFNHLDLKIHFSCFYLPPSHLWAFKWAENIPPSSSEDSAMAEALSVPPQPLQAGKNLSRSCLMQLSFACKAILRFSLVLYGSTPSLVSWVAQHLFSWIFFFFPATAINGILSKYVSVYTLVFSWHTPWEGLNLIVARLQFHLNHLPLSDLPCSDSILRTIRDVKKVHEMLKRKAVLFATCLDSPVLLSIAFRIFSLSKQCWPVCPFWTPSFGSCEGCNSISSLVPHSVSHILDLSMACHKAFRCILWFLEWNSELIVSF